MLKEKRDGLFIISFDCQKNFAIPKLPDQATYYSRQLYLYNFCIVQGSSKDPLKGNTFLYTWGEHELPKGSNEIASCVYHRLQNIDFTGISTLRCVADGCGGQNKNSVLLLMLGKWLLHKAPSSIKKIECIFPVPGHSFIPPDRVFAGIEKVIRKKEVISHPKDFFTILQSHGQVFHLGREFPDLDWKSETNVISKPPGQWHFKFAPSKRFFIKRNQKKDSILIQGEFAYKSEVGSYGGICRKGKNVGMANPKQISTGRIVNVLKVRDVNKLLKKHYGDNWQQIDSLEFYKNIISSQVASNNGSHGEMDLEENNTLCEETPEEIETRI